MTKIDKSIKIIIILSVAVVLFLGIMAVGFMGYMGVFDGKDSDKKPPIKISNQDKSQKTDTSEDTASSKDQTDKADGLTSVPSVESSVQSGEETENKIDEDFKEKPQQKIIEKFAFSCSFKEPEFLKRVYHDPINGNTLPYRLVMPLNYNASKKYPVILFLHGAGEIGSDNERQLNNMRNMFSYNGDLVSQAFVICPQSYEWWHLDRYSEGDRKGTLGSALHLLEELGQSYSFDKDRIYVTGLSMGGYATWSLLEECGGLFAAGMPVCGGGNSSNGYKLKDIPIRIYHSFDDPTVSFSASQSMHSAILNAGGTKAEFIALDGLGHNSWDYAYSDREAFCWMFAQNKAGNPSGKFEYTPYFRVFDSKNKCILSDADIDSISHYGSYSGGKYVYSVNIYLKTASAERLSKLYKSDKDSKYTVYWLNEKIYSYSVENIEDNNLFVILGVFNEGNVETFYNTISKSCEVLNR